MSDVETGEIDGLFSELLKNISQKSVDQQKEIKDLSTLVEIQAEQLKILRNELNSVNTKLNTLNNYVSPLIFKTVGDPIVTESKQKNVEQNVEQDDLTKLPAYAKTELFKEIRRPTNINELYMMVLQSQRTINELQTAVDSINRRN